MKENQKEIEEAGKEKEINQCPTVSGDIRGCETGTN